MTTGCGDSGSSADPPVKQVDSDASVKAGPDQYWVKLETTKGDVYVECNRKWSPYGSDRFYELVQSGFFDGCKFFRVIPGFVAQWGLNGDPSVNAKWRPKSIPDDQFKPGDPDRQSNKRGNIVFAKSQRPNSRSTQIFINTKSNDFLDAMGFTPFGQVLHGMAAVDSFYGEYGEDPQQSSQRIATEGNDYLAKAFPKLDSIKKATLLTQKPDLSKLPAE
jgi:peptidyl-prolyl cis-trans isomerase A (cyclophilin A)